MKTREEYFDDWERFNLEELWFLRGHFKYKLETARTPISPPFHRRIEHKLKCLNDFIAMKQLLEI